MPRRPRKTSALPPARRVALSALTSCLAGADAQAALDSALTPKRGAEPLSGRDTALATELVYGTLRLRSRLGWLLARFLKNPQGLPGPMQLALTLAAYEITQLSKVPAYASVDWCVEHVKSAINPRLAKVANAVLRKVADLGDEAAKPGFYRAEADDETEFLARWYAAPLWLVDLWNAAYGPTAAEQLLTAQTRPAPLGLRVRANRPGAEALLERLRGHESCLASAGWGVALSETPEDLAELLSSGAVLRQSLAGQQAMAAIGCEDWPRPVWDACCGRGGKTLLLADAAGGPILASDPSLARLKGLKRELSRLDLSGVAVARAKADLPAPLPGPVPVVLLDAPCSGLGVLSRRPDAKAKRVPEDLARLAALQDRILDNAAAAVAPAGVLAYVTCTLNPAENEQRVREFLKRHREFSLDIEWSTPPDSPLHEFFYAARLSRED